MGKFPFKRPRIISKKFPELDSSIDGVTKSLNDLVFTYREQVHQALSKKHWMMAFSSLALLIVLGSFISPKGKADSSIFYPDTCLGGWANPQNAQGEPQTTSNGDESQFTKANSAILPEKTNAEMYCGNFKGKFDAATRPTKIIVSLALTKGIDHPDEELVPVPMVSTTTEAILDVASSTASTTLLISSETEVGTSTVATSSQSTTTDTIETAIATPGKAKDEGPSVVEGIVKSVQDTINDLFKNNEEKATQTDTVVIPLPVPVEPAPTEPAPVITEPEVSAPPQNEAPAAESPTSYAPSRKNFLSHFVQTVFAEEVVTTSSTPEVQVLPQEEEPKKSEVVEATPVNIIEEVVQTSVLPELKEETKEIIPETVTTDEAVLGVATSTESVVLATTTDSVIEVASSSVGTTTEIVTVATTTSETASTPDEGQSQNNFLEIFYTFDGKTWESLGVLNEISMKYRTFEIPVTASTSWTDMSQLQIKIEAKKHEEDTPMVYLDGVKVEVLYETSLEHVHPDFKRDTILKDEVIDGIRIVTIINNDTNKEEVWYMYVEEVSTSTEQTASSTQLTASSTEIASTTTRTTDSAVSLAIRSSTDQLIADASSSQLVSTTTEVAATSSTVQIKPVMPKNAWFKFEGKTKGVAGQALALEIKKLDEEKLDPEVRDRLPDFALDTIKKIRGAILQAVVVQVQKDSTDELWLYDLEADTQEKIKTGSSTSVSSAYPLGFKSGYIFWLSQDESTVHAYDSVSKVVLEKIVPNFDGSKGERAEVIFDEIPWKVIVSTEGFSFYSEGSGEVFSDENSSVVDIFRKKLQLDTVLNKEELSELSFPVDDGEMPGE
jgi:hypothetical protein